MPDTSSRNTTASPSDANPCASTGCGFSPPSPPMVDRWLRAYARYTASVAVLHGMEMVGDTAIDAALAEEEAATLELMVTPAPSFDWVATKFSIARESFVTSDGGFIDRREMIFLAAIEADVMQLSDLLWHELSSALTRAGE